jgi:hypothetical protein
LRVRVDERGALGRTGGRRIPNNVCKCVFRGEEIIRLMTNILFVLRVLLKYGRDLENFSKSFKVSLIYFFSNPKL